VSLRRGTATSTSTTSGATSVDLDRRVRLQIAIPVGARAEPGENDNITGCGPSDDFEHGLVATPGAAADVMKAEEPVTK
jgi:hypothetical protein